MLTKRPHAFKQLYLVGQRKRQLIMYSLDMRVSYSIFRANFTAHNGSREALNFRELPHRLHHRFHHRYLVTAEK